MERKIVFLVLPIFLISALGCEPGPMQKKTMGDYSDISAVPPGAYSEREEESAKTSKDFNIFPVYTDRGFFDNHYIPSGYMGDYGDINVNENWKDNPHSGQTCIKTVYTARGSQGAGWAGIYWQNPANNWGTIKGGFDLTGASKLTFWTRGERGGELISEFKIGGITGEYADTDAVMIGPITLTKSWKKYTIDLKGADLSYISGGFCWAASSANNPEGFTFYLDDIKYE